MSIAGFIQKITRLPMRIFVKAFFGAPVFGLENFKNETRRQFIIAANHCGRIDPWLAGYFMPRKIFYHSKALRFMAYESYMKTPFLGLFLKSWGAYSIGRSSGKPLEETLKETMAVLKNGHSLVIFPEGKIIREGDKPIARPGIAYLAKETSLPIMPVSIQKERRKFLFPKFTLVFGAPFYYNDISDLSNSDFRAASEKIMEKVMILKQRFKPPLRPSTEGNNSPPVEGCPPRADGVV